MNRKELIERVVSNVLTDFHLNIVKSLLICPKCNKQYDIHDMFCSVCGTKFEGDDDKSKIIKEIYTEICKEINSDICRMDD